MSTEQKENKSQVNYFNSRRYHHPSNLIGKARTPSIPNITSQRRKKLLFSRHMTKKTTQVLPIIQSKAKKEILSQNAAQGTQTISKPNGRQRYATIGK